MEEIEFYNDGNVSVTNSRFRVGSTTYAMNGVTSVKRGETDPSKVAPIVVALVGIAMVFLAATFTFKIVGGLCF